MSAFGTSRHFAGAKQFGRFPTEADMSQQARLVGSVENDPSATSAAWNGRPPLHLINQLADLGKSGFMDRYINAAERGAGRGTRPESLSRGGPSGHESDGVDLNLRVQQQAGDLHGGASGRVFRKELSADA
jgi:hypothetical protein